MYNDDSGFIDGTEKKDQAIQSKKIMKIVFAGAGNVASHLGPVIARKHEILQVYSPSSSAEKLASKLSCDFTNDASSIFTDIDLLLIVLRDEAIAPFIEKLNFVPKLVAHTSGSVPLNVFPEKFNNKGVLYPMMTFSKASTPDYHQIPFCIEGSNNTSIRILTELAGDVSEFVIEMSSDDRKTAHLAAVFASNFTNHLYHIAGKILSEKNLPFDLLRPLIFETAKKVQLYSPEEMQTGPARRGDAEIISEHLKMLKEDKTLHEVYEIFSREIETLYGKRL
jgi:predicted short-subunit dehydrogenase-like oxidoreductase (DUF2520 family)